MRYEIIKIECDDNEKCGICRFLKKYNQRVPDPGNNFHLPSCRLFDEYLDGECLRCQACKDNETRMHSTEGDADCSIQGAS